MKSQQVELSERRRNKEKKEQQKQMTLEEYLRNHSNFKNLTADKIEIFRRYIEENQRGRYIKQTRSIGRSFIDKCPVGLLRVLVSKIYKQFQNYLRLQKKSDDEKIRKIGQISDQWWQNNDNAWHKDIQQLSLSKFYNISDSYDL